MRLSLGPDLAALKAAALIQIDAEAEATRLAFVTGGSGQALEYQATEAQGRAAVAAHAAGQTLDPADYPFVVAEATAFAEVGITVSLLDAAQQVVVLADAWETTGSLIKALRRGAKLRVEAATTPAQVIAAASGIPWPTP
tara:strand:- start:22085 stop:22504 length:420 start_codon:yes stop_codon:yes gene_type:complete